MSRCPICKKRKCSCRKSHKKSDLFRSPSNCPEKIQTPRFPSPNSSLSSDKLDTLQHCIAIVNDLLRSLGSESDSTNTRQIQLHFLSLRNVFVKIKINCEKWAADEPGVDSQEIIEIEADVDSNEIITIEPERKKGLFVTAGQNFIQLSSADKYIFVLYTRLISVAHENLETSKHQEQEFIDIDQFTRKEMVLNFGDFVSKNLQLVNFFFGIPLHIQLLTYLGKDIKVKTDDDNIIEGTLFEVDEGKINIGNKNDLIEINMEKICFLEVLDIEYT